MTQAPIEIGPCQNCATLGRDPVKPVTHFFPGGGMIIRCAVCHAEVSNAHDARAAADVWNRVELPCGCVGDTCKGHNTYRVNYVSAGNPPEFRPLTQEDLWGGKQASMTEAVSEAFGQLDETEPLAQAASIVDELTTKHKQLVSEMLLSKPLSCPECGLIRHTDGCALGKLNREYIETVYRYWPRRIAMIKDYRSDLRPKREVSMILALTYPTARVLIAHADRSEQLEFMRKYEELWLFNGGVYNTATQVWTFPWGATLAYVLFARFDDDWHKLAGRDFTFALADSSIDTKLLSIVRMRTRGEVL